MKPEEKDEFQSNLAKLYASLKNELQIKQSPKVTLVSDQKNADKILGKTGYYDPAKKSIHLFITDRHPKDVLRSFAHEVIHHWQHENEQLQTSSKGKKGEDPQYAQHDPWLRQMEKQAYLLGNIMFRDWEDKKKTSDHKAGKTEPVKEEIDKNREERLKAAYQKAWDNGDAEACVYYYNTFNNPQLIPNFDKFKRSPKYHDWIRSNKNKIDAVKQEMQKFNSVGEQTMLIGKQYPPQHRGSEYKDIAESLIDKPKPFKQPRATFKFTRKFLNGDKEVQFPVSYRYNGGTIIGGKWYSGYEVPPPIVPSGYKLVSLGVGLQLNSRPPFATMLLKKLTK